MMYHDESIPVWVTKDGKPLVCETCGIADDFHPNRGFDQIVIGTCGWCTRCEDHSTLVTLETFKK